MRIFFSYIWGWRSHAIGVGFRKHLRDAEDDDKHTSKPTSRTHNMTICDLSVNKGANSYLCTQHSEPSRNHLTLLVQLFYLYAQITTFPPMA